MQICVFRNTLGKGDIRLDLLNRFFQMREFTTTGWFQNNLNKINVWIKTVKIEESIPSQISAIALMPQLIQYIEKNNILL